MKKVNSEKMSVELEIKQKENVSNSEEEVENILNKYSDLYKKIDLAKLPEIIDQQIKKIDELSKQIKASTASAAAAKNAFSALDEKPKGLLRQKKINKNFQETLKKNIDASEENAKANQLNFEYSKQLGEVSKFLLAIAAMSSDHTDKAIEKITNAIESSSDTALSDEAVEYLQKITLDIKRQRNAIKRQEALELELSEQQTRLKEKDVLDNLQDVQIELSQQKDREHDNLIEQNKAIIKKLEKKISDLERWKIILLFISTFSLILSLMQLFGIL